MLRLTFILLAVISQSLLAQPLDVRIHSIDAQALPQIRMQVAVTKGGRALPQPGKAAFSLLENGLAMTLDVDCPDSAVTNNVALVLDNSGSLSGAAFDSLKAGAHAAVDSLGNTDATAIYHFSNGGERVLDFTTDKAALHAAVSALAIGANTPIYQTTDLALGELAARAGKKYCIVFTDGVDNASSVQWQDLIPKAQAAGIRIYIIGFGNTELSDDILSTIAGETGGRYWRIFSPALIAGILRSIAGEIVSPYCTISYEAAGCADSLRFMQLSASLGTETAVDDTVFAGPFRADTIRARIVAPRRILPGGGEIVYIALEPGLHTGLELSFRFLIRYDPALLNVTPVMPVTVGTITQNTGARLRQLRPGVLEFTAERVSPGMAAGNLIGVVLRHVAADSSRPVPLMLDSLTLIAGCPTTVILFSDTMDVCQCVETLPYAFDTLATVASGSTADIPLRISLPVTDIPVLLRARLRWDAGHLRILSVADGDGEGWEILADEAAGTAMLSLYTRSGKSELLPRLQFAVKGERSPVHAYVRVDSMTMYADCCADAGADSALLWIDGICDPLLRLRNAPAIISAWPNPARDMLHVRVRIPGIDHRPAILELYDAAGERVHSENITLADAESTLPVENLTPGHYTLRLESGGVTVLRPVIVLR
ncbi:MAG: VWA domain-containing protein [Bacteroidetes bacterium]|nr:VWA domain-containing protein [Bacteroidota bacterium]